MDLAYIFDLINDQEFSKINNEINALSPENITIKMHIEVFLLHQYDLLQDALGKAITAIELSKQGDKYDEVVFGFFNLLRIKLKLGKLSEIPEMLVEANLYVSQNLPNKSYLYYRALAGIAKVECLYLMQSGNPFSALSKLKNAENYWNQIDEQQGIATVNQDRGYIYLKIGEFDKALKYLNISKQMFLEVGSLIGALISTSNLAEISLRVGDLDNAASLLNEALEYVSNNKAIVGYPQVFFTVYLRLGKIEKSKGNYELARDYFQIADEIVRKYNNPMFISEILLETILLDVDVLHLEEAEVLFHKLQQITKNTSSKLLHLRVQFAKALLRKASAIRIRDLLISKEIYSEIIHDQIINDDLYTLSLIEYIEILFFELQVFSSKEVLLDIQNYIAKLLDISIKQRSVILSIEAYILQSRTWLILMESKDMLSSLQKAQKLAEDFNLHSYKLRINKAIKEFGMELEKMRTITSNNDFATKIVDPDFKNYLNKVSKVVHR